MTAKILLPKEFEERLEKLKSKYPDSRSAIMPALFLAQEHFGFISDEAIQWVSTRLDVAPIHVMEVSTFYTMYYKRRMGRYHIQVCRTMMCQLKGSRRIIEYLKKRFGIEAGEVSPDGMFSYEEVECLGSCGSAPVCEINDTYFEHLNEEKLESIIQAIETAKPDLSYSTMNDKLGKGLEVCPRSKIA
ncbi:MAG: NAD(P)H-dependent oxidoreductase subunit E [SAR324 cluster bacterium]|uniref:NAD(P)H-dependent oxidoreductase subunit E n=1 Tax=SAR324 cluster bacterium TaxID=2024889 RepID=A0A7X9FRD8_9DELT|nr:NAD(P)H-dependent oxidoreductase subunit E [SAR324 cluster bacterium]